MLELKNIDIEITNHLSKIREIYSDSPFQYVCEFNLDDESINHIPFDALKIPGIYLFEIKNRTSTNFSEWIAQFKLKFRGVNKEFLHKFTPNIIEKRIINQPEKIEWIPFYIGKCQNIGKRVNEHINSTLGKPPFALKLKGRGNLGEEKFRLKVIEINVVNYSVIVTEIENTLRNLHNPIVGKQ